MKTNDKLRVFDIQRLSLNDGPGIRNTIFLKGCFLKCIWCHNPESMAFQTQIMHIERICTKCGECVKVCPVNAIDEKFNSNIAKCIECGACVNACVYGARKICGVDMKVDDIVDVVLQDREYYDSSGGGVTISGGEPLYQYNSLKSLLAKLKEKGISTALDTTGYASQDWFLDICKIVNIVLFDIKHMDDEIHRKLTGVGNELILNNFRELIKLGKEVYVRYPMIKGYNDDMDNIKEMCGLLKEAGINQLDVIPFHDIGESKYYSISYEPIHIEKHTDDEIRNRIKLIEKYGIKARII